MGATMITKYGVGTLFGAIHDYLEVYLPKQRNLSEHTQMSYRAAQNALVDFVKIYNKVPLLDVTFEMLTEASVTAFLDSLETDCGYEVSSRNTRRAAIRAFLKYAADRDVVNVAFLQDMKNVALKKPDKSDTPCQTAASVICSATMPAKRGSTASKCQRMSTLTNSEIHPKIKSKLSGDNQANTDISDIKVWILLEVMFTALIRRILAVNHLCSSIFY